MLYLFDLISFVSVSVFVSCIYVICSISIFNELISELVVLYHIFVLCSIVMIESETHGNSGIMYDT